MTPEERTRATAILAGAGIVDAQREVRRLWRESGQKRTVFDAWLTRRAAREPMSHILGYRDFFKHRFEVTSDVLDPRPETETLIEEALRESFGTVLDLGTGSGCILLSLLCERPDTTGTGTDISPAALEVAHRNAIQLKVQSRAVLLRSDWFANVTGCFDLIVSNPPYIGIEEIDGLEPEVRVHEPRAALTDEADGLTAYRRIARDVTSFLRPGGRVLLEIGATQGPTVAEILAAQGLADVNVLPDLDGRDRVISARKPAL